MKFGCRSELDLSCRNGCCNVDFMLGLGDGNFLLVCTSFTGGGCRSSTSSLAGHVYHRCFAHSSPARLLTLAFVPSLSGTILNVHINKYNILHTFSTLHAFCWTWGYIYMHAHSLVAFIQYKIHHTCAVSHVCIYIYTCIHTHSRIWQYMYMYTDIYIYIYIYIHIYVYIDMYIYK